ncbi:hypothetical protein RQP46_004730 [Phenoliferia psychrophenolica]
MSKRNIIITLLRNDLRTTDNALLHGAHQPHASGATHVLPVYVFDERFIELSGFEGYKREGPEARTRLFGFWRTSVFRARFLAEAVYDLRDRLRNLHKSDLLIRFGKAELVIADLVKKIQEGGDTVSGVYLQKEFYSEERKIEDRIRKAMMGLGTPITFFDTTPLIDVRDLPFAVHDTPDVFTPFRKRIEDLGHWGRAPLPTPKSFKPFPALKVATTSFGATLDGCDVEQVIPSLLKPLAGSYESKYSNSETPRGEKSAVPFRGGETAARERLAYYFHEGAPPPAAIYKETRNGLLGHAYSTKLSLFLVLGTVSPRTVMACLDEHERKFGATQNTYWVRFELLWRDYFLYIARKFGSHIFRLGGLEEVTDPKMARTKTWPGWWNEWDRKGGDEQPAVRWMDGKTGVPFIDANMAELRETGFMSNRGRQNVASFLTKDLQVDWRLGAEFFEAHLIDHEFNPIKQGNDYDPVGEYIKTWLPQLQNVSSAFIQSPWRLSPQDRQRCISGAYPATPVIEQSHWKPHYTKRGANKMSGNSNERIRTPNPGPQSGRGGGASGRGGGGGGRGGAPGASSRGRGGGRQQFVPVV